MLDWRLGCPLAPRVRWRWRRWRYRPVISVTSAASRCSIGISATPSATVQSIVVDGIATQNGTLLSWAASAFRYVPILLATSPARVTRSVPTITRSTIAVLHQMPAGVVGNHGVRHAMPAEFPGSERRTLIARPGFVHPDMQVDPRVVRRVDWRKGGAPIDGRQPAGVAVGQHVDATPCCAACSISGSPWRPIASFCAASSSAIAAAS